MLAFPRLSDAPAELAEIKRILPVGWDGSVDVTLTVTALALWRAAKPRPLAAASGTYRTAY
jgi:hypothetical protein